MSPNYILAFRCWKTSASLPALLQFFFSDTIISLLNIVINLIDTCPTLIPNAIHNLS